MINTIPSSCPLKCVPKISLDDFEAHQKTCFKKLSPEVPHPEAQSEDILDDAIKAKRAQNTSSRAGTIEGFYIQSRKHYPIKGTFTIKDRVVMITTFDPVGSADWGGEIDLKNLSIQLIKSYRAARKVYYRGRFNENVTKLVGSWDFEQIMHSHEIRGQGFELNFISEDK